MLYAVVVEVSIMKPEQIEQCAQQLVEFHRRFAPLFYEKRQAHWAYKWLYGLLLEGVRKNAATVARAVPGGDVQSMQQFISDSPWDHRSVIGELQALVAQRLGHPEAVLVCDETGFPKKGDKSVGVARQYSGTLGKVDNCQMGVKLAYISKRGRTLVDEDLYLPKEWIEDNERRTEAQIPAQVRFRTKPQIALEMIREAARGPLPFRWIACDDLYGHSGAFRDGLEELGLLYVADVPSNTKVWSQMPRLRGPGAGGAGRPRTKRSLHPDAPAPTKVRELADKCEDWATIEVRAGAKKPIRSAWVALRVYPWRDGLPGTQCWLVIEKTPEDEFKYYLSNAPGDTPLGKMAQVAKMEWFVEQCFRDAKQHVGLSDFEVRKWRGWHHHMVMCMLAQAFLATLCSEWKKGAFL